MIFYSSCVCVCVCVYLRAGAHVLDRSLNSAVFCFKLKYKSIVLKHLFNQELSILHCVS